MDFLHNENCKNAKNQISHLDSIRPKSSDTVTIIMTKLTHERQVQRK